MCTILVNSYKKYIEGSKETFNINKTKTII
jgi:hypothetical protein